MKKLLIIGIDSLDPYTLKKYQRELPNFSRLMGESPTFMTKSIFPVDTIPAWASIYTGLHPGKHGLLYVFDVFDPNLSDLKKLSISGVKGRTVWDYASKAGYRTLLVNPMLLYPAWEINGAMVSKSPYDRRINWITTEFDVDACPPAIKEKYGIGRTVPGLWGGFPGISRMKEWADTGKAILTKEIDTGLEICKNEPWDVYFTYFNLLDVVQHRFWRFFDETDPTYPGKNEFEGIVLDFYRMLDDAVGRYMQLYPDASLIVVSDHGHGVRPLKTININEHLRRKGYLATNGRSKAIVSKAKNVGLEMANRLKIEHLLIKAVTKNSHLTKATKSLYSSSGLINKEKSKAYLSNFAGIKSYPHGGVQINKDLISAGEYDVLRDELIKALYELKTPAGEPVVEWAKKREDMYPGEYTAKLYPDVVFELKDNYGVGWEVYSGLYGKSYDHNVASGGHRKDAVLLMRNIDRTVKASEVSILDIAPSIMDLLGIGPGTPDMAGKSIYNG